MDEPFEYEAQQTHEAVVHECAAWRARTEALVGAAQLALDGCTGASKAADELMTEYVSKQRAAKWGVVNDGLVAATKGIGAVRAALVRLPADALAERRALEAAFDAACLLERESSHAVECQFTGCTCGAAMRRRIAASAFNAARRELDAARREASERRDVRRDAPCGVAI